MTQNDIIHKQTTVPKCCVCNIKATQIVHGSWLCNKHFEAHKKRIDEIRKAK